MIESRVDVSGDLDMINRGEALHQGESYLVNGRMYGREPGGRIYPISGPGIHQLNRGAYRALGVYNTFGQSTRAEEILDAMSVGQPERAAALRAWLAEREG